MSDEERAKGFVRPVRDSYMHLHRVLRQEGSQDYLVPCGCVTTMGRALAETYARDPSFYGGTFCAGCGKHFSLVEAVNNERVRMFAWEPKDGSFVGE